MKYKPCGSLLYHLFVFSFRHLIVILSSSSSVKHQKDRVSKYYCTMLEQDCQLLVEVVGWKRVIFYRM